MFPGFFSPNAADGPTSRPELYDRDRPLFRKYVPLCKLVAEAGWEPITRRAPTTDFHVERFGARYLTVFNDGPERRTATLTLDGDPAAEPRDLVSGPAATFGRGQGRRSRSNPKMWP